MNLKQEMMMEEATASAELAGAKSEVKCCELCKGQRVIADTDGNTIPACHFCPCHKESPMSQSEV